MAFCVQCGAEAPGNFCPRCGASISQSLLRQEGIRQELRPAMPRRPWRRQRECQPIQLARSATWWDWLPALSFWCWIRITKIKPVRFHAFQSIFFHVGVIVAMIALTILGSFLSLLTHGLAGLLTLVLWPLLMLAIFVLWLYLMWAAYNNKMVVLPIVGPLAQKQA